MNPMHGVHLIKARAIADACEMEKYDVADQEFDELEQAEAESSTVVKEEDHAADGELSDELPSPAAAAPIERFFGYFK